MKIAIILAEFGKPAPDVSQYRECWPDANIGVYSEADCPPVAQFEGDRYGWRMNDYYSIRKALENESGADVAIVVDGDMWICDMPKMRTLPKLAERFGICLPLNPRYTVALDTMVGADSDHSPDPLRSGAPGVNCSPVAISLQNMRAVQLAHTYCTEMLERPVRGPLAWWRAMERTGTAPLILPPQWCVCERHIGIGGEIMLHHGHDAVKRQYGNLRIA